MVAEEAKQLEHFRTSQCSSSDRAAGGHARGLDHGHSKVAGAFQNPPRGDRYMATSKALGKPENRRDVISSSSLAMLADRGWSANHDNDWTASSRPDG